MSYCRFSSEDYQCDVYAYAAVALAWLECIERTNDE